MDAGGRGKGREGGRCEDEHVSTTYIFLIKSNFIESGAAVKTSEFWPRCEMRGLFRRAKWCSAWFGQSHGAPLKLTGSAARPGSFRQSIWYTRGHCEHCILFTNCVPLLHEKQVVDSFPIDRRFLFFVTRDSYFWITRAGGLNSSGLLRR